MHGPLPCYQKTDSQNGMVGAMESKTETANARAHPSQSPWLGLAALFALSPILVDWGFHLVETPSSRYAALFPVLYLIGIRHDARERVRKDGYLLLALAIALVILSVGGGFTRWGRIAVPITLVAMIRLSGLASTRGALTMLWFVPVPHFIEMLAWPELVLFYAQSLPGLTISLESARVVLGSGVSVLQLAPADAGLPLMASLSGISYFASWQRREPLLRTGVRMGVSVVLALPIQYGAVWVAIILLRSDFPHAAQIWINSTIWVFSLLWLVASVPRLKC